MYERNDRVRMTSDVNITYTSILQDTDRKVGDGEGEIHDGKMAGIVILGIMCLEPQKQRFQSLGVFRISRSNTD